VDKFEALRELLASVDDDYQKAKGGNKAAGTRVRKALQEVRTTAADLRKEILEYRATTQTG
jgi:signal transduction histidine kinase